MMTPARGLFALGLAFAAGLGLVVVVLDSPDDGQRIETRFDAMESSSADADPASAEDQPLLVAMADAGNRTVLAVADDQPGDAPAKPEERTTIEVDTAPDPSTTSAPPGTATGSSGPDSSGPAGDTPTGPTPSSAASPSSTVAQSTGATGTPSTGTTGTPSTQAPTTPSTQAPSPSGGSGAAFESIRNTDPRFTQYENVPESGLSIDALTYAAPRPDNGAHPDGNFRMACAYSHFSYDDPIVYPGQPGKSHLHMFFGNTRTDAHTTTSSLVDSGGGSCNGFELNRSGYWTPAVLDGKGNTVVPDKIILYYKTKRPTETVAMPQGLKMIAGNPRSESFTADQRLGWGCGGSGTTYTNTNRIPNNCGGDQVNFHVQFPFCWDGKNLDSADHISHMAYADGDQPCPSAHPVRLPQITILAYFPPGDTNGWYLSSDRSNGFNTGAGATLHADWFGGWHEGAMNLWIDGCIRAARNCSFGQTGTSRQLAKLNDLQDYTGPNVLPLP